MSPSLPKTGQRFDLNWVLARLPERRIEWFDSIGSTMTVAAELAREGCPNGTVVGANAQTAGVGRHGRAWHSEPGQGLYVSIVLRLPVAAHALPVAMLALGLATQEALAAATQLAPDLRWPNDVLVGGRKCAGILAQLEGGAVIAGIGINVSQAAFPNNLATPATSLLLEGAAVPREELLVWLVMAVDRCCKILSEEGPGAVIAAFVRGSSYATGRRVRAESNGREIQGVTGGLDASGFLIVREDDGRQSTILTGGVRSI